MVKKIALLLIRIYQKTSFLQNNVAKTIFMTEGICRFTPTCSEYTYQAIKKYGTLKGSFMGFKRILRCNPKSRGGHDPVP